MPSKDEVVKICGACKDKYNQRLELPIGTIEFRGVTCFACGQRITSVGDLHFVWRSWLGHAIGDGHRDPPAPPGPAPRIRIGFKGMRVHAGKTNQKGG